MGGLLMVLFGHVRSVRVTGWNGRYLVVGSTFIVLSRVSSAVRTEWVEKAASAVGAPQAVRTDGRR
ncbi:hypothetical protein GCM10009099_11020 [Caenispirillum bisanense]